jgi:NAD-dependent SIR2 family protein deacetylase
MDAAPDDVATTRALALAAAMIDSADGLLITAGAGFGVDSGLPDFRGNQGFWNAYPALGRRGIGFESIACPDAFTIEPTLAWGFYGHRLQLYREVTPHRGFELLHSMAQRIRHGAFVFTSNVDGHFQKAGYAAAQVCEIHGSIHHLQCLSGCGAQIWRADEVHPDVDAEHCLLRSPLPCCPRCGGSARPNILMFGDWGWQAERTAEQQQRLGRWLAALKRPVVVELGAGTEVATVRRFSERFLPDLIRINPTAAAIPGGRGVSLALGARAACEQLHAALAARGRPGRVG